MARAKTKQDLLLSANAQFQKLWQQIDAMSAAQQNASFNFPADIGKEAHWQRDKNIRDVLIHLYEWHRLLLKWVEANQNGQTKPFLPPPYNWKTYGAMNVAFWQKHQETPYATAKDLVKESHHKVMALIETFSDEELFTKGCLAWTGGSTLGQYCVSASASHYDWAMKKLKAHSKTYQA